MYRLVINGEILENYEGFSFSDKIDSLTASLEFATYEYFAPAKFQIVKLYRDGVLKFKGEILQYNYTDNTPEQPNSYTCFSHTHVLEECVIPLDAYPLQTQDKTLKDIISSILPMVDKGLRLVVDSSAKKEVEEVITVEDVKPETKISAYFNSLCTQKGLIMSHNNYGNLLLTKRVIGRLKEYPKYISKNTSVNVRGLYGKYNVVGQQGIENDTPIEKTVTLPNLPQSRNLTNVQSSGNNSNINNFAVAMRSDSLKNYKITCTYGDFFPSLGDQVKFDTNYIVNDFTVTYKTGGEDTTVNYLRKEVYERS